MVSTCGSEAVVSVDGGVTVQVVRWSHSCLSLFLSQHFPTIGCAYCANEKGPWIALGREAFPAIGSPHVESLAVTPSTIFYFFFICGVDEIALPCFHGHTEGTEDD